MTPHFDIMQRIGEVKPTDKILVPGCGQYASDIARQILDIECETLTSIDVYEPNIKVLKNVKPKAKNHVIIQGDIREIEYAEHDIVLLIDVIEHIPKEDGKKFLERLEKLNAKIIVFVPLEPVDFHRSHQEYENPAEEHVSWWGEGDFSGYKTERITNCHSERLADGNYIYWDALWAVKSPS